jgi:hypothetical protein
VLVLRYRDLASAQQRGSPSEAGRKLMGLIDRATLTSTFYEVVSPPC